MVEEKQPTAHGGQFPSVNRVTFADLNDVLKAGLQDFRTAPLFGLFFGGVYAVGGLILIAAVMMWNMHWMAYPLIIGFALVGPFAATGLYEVSRRLETGKALTWSAVLGVIREQHRRELGWMAFVMLFVFWVWMYQARTLFAVFFGSKGFASYSGFVEAVLTTANGWTFLIVGHVVGAVISMILFALTVVSCPFLLDRDVDFVTAMVTSVRAVVTSPAVMGAWGLFVVLCVVISALPGFLGLLITLPVFGHATWHLYRRVIAKPDTAKGAS